MDLLVLFSVSAPWSMQESPPSSHLVKESGYNELKLDESMGLFIRYQSFLPMQCRGHPFLTDLWIFFLTYLWMNIFMDNVRTCRGHLYLTYLWKNIFMDLCRNIFMEEHVYGFMWQHIYGFTAKHIHLFLSEHIYGDMEEYINGFMAEHIYVYTREIPAFGGISLTLRESGAFGHTIRAPSAPISRRLRR